MDQLRDRRRRGKSRLGVVAVRRPGAERASCRHRRREEGEKRQRDQGHAVDRGPGERRGRGRTLVRNGDLHPWDDWGGWWDHVTPPDVEQWSDGTQFRYG